MVEPFEYRGSPAQIIFGVGERERVLEVLAGLGVTRALVLSTPQRKGAARCLADDLGETAAGVFSEAAMHTPVEVTERALRAMADAGADGTVALGGGSTIGLGKAIAYRLDTPQLAIPTTYAGSEATPILGETSGGEKRTVTDPKVLPEAVIYDPALTTGLPPAITVASALNALAHAAEALYARERNPITSLMAAEGVRAFVRALPVLAETPDELSARSDALYGAWLCGTVLGTVGMALHHKLCHVLGGSFGLPHAETHAIVLPHAVAYNEVAAREELAPLAAALGGVSAGEALHAFAHRIGAPTALASIGMTEADLPRAAQLAVERPYWNPREITPEGIERLLTAAFRGDPPAG